VCLYVRVRIEIANPLLCAIFNGAKILVISSQKLLIDNAPRE
jgi:hypothetical protein